MIKNFRWAVLALLVGGAIVWLVMAGVGRKGESSAIAPRENKGRESSRHRTGEVKKNLATPLEKQVAQQERLVEDKKAVLAGLAKARGPILLNPIGGAPPDETPEDAAKKAQATQDFEKARREYFVDRQLLQKLKAELAEEQAKGK